MEPQGPTEEQREKILELVHSMQTGVQFEIAHEEGTVEIDFGPSSSASNRKHLRVGVNNALVEIGALRNTLIKCGVFEEHIFWSTYIEALEEEVKGYEKKLSEFMGSVVHLH